MSLQRAAHRDLVAQIEDHAADVGPCTTAGTDILATTDVPTRSAIAMASLGLPRDHRQPGPVGS